MSELPTFVGLCPSEHSDEFYMPLEEGDSTICPSCDRPMVVYAREAAHRREERLKDGVSLPREYRP